MSARRIPISRLKVGDTLLYLGQEYPVDMVTHGCFSVQVVSCGGALPTPFDVGEYVWIVDTQGT